MLTPSRASISARRRGMVQLGRSATGSASRGMATRSATSLFTGAGPGATAAFNASTSPLMKSPRQSRTVSSRTPNASAIRPLVQPVSVSSTARARSASPRSREHAKQANSACWSLVADKRDFPAMLSDRKSLQSGNQTTIRWSTRRFLLRPAKCTNAQHGHLTVWRARLNSAHARRIRRAGRPPSSLMGCATLRIQQQLGRRHARR